jgi:hypothetical protein
VSRFTSGYQKVWRDALVGGVGPYTSYWYGQLCYQDGYCGSNQLLTSTTSDTITLYIPPDMVYIDLNLVVGDASPDTTWIGTYRRRFLGPVSIVPQPTDQCNDDPSVGYPFQIAVPPDPVHDSTYYRVNVCDWSDVFLHKQGS